MGLEYGTCGRGEKSVQDGKARSKGPTLKTEAKMRGWDEYGSQGDWFGSVEWIPLAQNSDW